LLEYRWRPEKDYLKLAPWEELFRRTESWKNELAFYEDELHFFEDLISLNETDSDKNIQQLKQSISDAFLQLKSLMIQTDQHLAHIGKIIKESDNNDDLLFREEHNVLEDNIIAFERFFRDLKQKLFKTVGKKRNPASKR
jgi:hypothetical protein